MRLKFLARFRDEGLLLMRLGLGGMFLLHGWPKIAGGPEKWSQLGKAVAYLGIDFFPVGWGLMAALSEFGGGLCLILGLLFRPAALMMAATMAVATSMHLGKGDGLMTASHAIELGIVFIGLALIGPGRYSIDK